MPDQTLAQKIKAKFPGQYDDLPDAELEARIVAKYPGAYDDLPRTSTAAGAGQGATLANEPAPSPIPEGNALGARLGHQAGLTVRGGVEGAAGLPAMGGDIVNHLINLGITKFNETAGTKIPTLNMPSEVLSRKLTDLGVAVPQNSVEQAVLAATKGMAGGATIAGAAGALAPTSAVGQGVADTLAANPGLQVVGGGTGATASDLTRQAGGGPLAQAAAGIAGGMAPSLPSLAGAATRAALGSKVMPENVATYEAAGTTPTVAQAAEGTGARAAEGLLSKVPISADRMRNKFISQQSDIGSKVGDIAEDLYPGADPTLAGREIEKGVGGFAKQFKNTAGKLYDRVDQFIPPDSEVPVTNFRSTLADLTAPNPDAPALTAGMIQPKLKAMAGALEQDLNPQLVGSKVAMAGGMEFEISPQLKTMLGLSTAPKSTLPYSAMKDLRTRVGSMLSTNELMSDIPRAQLKQVYAALSNDMENAAIINDADAGYYGPSGTIISEALKKSAPIPQQVIDSLKEQPGPALAAVNRASQYYKAGSDRIDQLQTVVDKLNPEKIFSAAVGGSKDGATQIRTLMKSLPPEANDAITAVVVKRMGRATSANQNAAGDVFSTETFLTNWNKLDPKAKAQLFSDTDVRTNLDAVAKVASKLRMGNRTYANPSGSGAAMIAGGTIGGAIVSALSGHPGVALGTAGLIGGANLGARLMTSPTFTRWLASAATASPEQLGTQLNVLAQGTNDAQEQMDIEALRKRLEPPPVKKKAGGSVSAAQLLAASRRYATR